MQPTTHLRPKLVCFCQQHSVLYNYDEIKLMQQKPWQVILSIILCSISFPGSLSVCGSYYTTCEGVVQATTQHREKPCSSVQIPETSLQRPDTGYQTQVFQTPDSKYVQMSIGNTENIKPGTCRDQTKNIRLKHRVFQTWGILKTNSHTVLSCSIRSFISETSLGNPRKQK